MAGSTALVSDIDRRKAVPIIRSLGRAGVRVIGMSPHGLPTGAFSRWCERFHLTPDAARDPDAFLERLERVIDRERPDVLYPIEDATLGACVAHPERWRGVRALLPPPGALAIAADKWRTLETARTLGMHMPPSWCPETRDDVVALASTLHGAFVIKPRTGSGSRGLVFVNAAGALPAAWERVARQHPRPIVQQRLAAAGAGVGYSLLIAGDGTALARFGHRRLREYPVQGGPSTLRESYVDEGLAQQTLALLRHIGFRGIAMVEYKLDADGRPALMEINPRFWGSLQLAIQAGVDFPLLYHRAALGLPVSPVLDYPTGTMCRWLWPGDVLHFLSNPDRFRLKPSFFRFGGPGLGYDLWSPDDPGPVLGITLEALRKAFAGR